MAQLVESRAAGRCEYCQMHQALQGATFHVEHVVPDLTAALPRSRILRGPVRAAICAKATAFRKAEELFQLYPPSQIGK